MKYTDGIMVAIGVILTVLLIISGLVVVDTIQSDVGPEGEAVIEYNTYMDSPAGLAVPILLSLLFWLLFVPNFLSQRFQNGNGDSVE